MNDNKTFYKNLLLHEIEIFSKAVAGVLLFYTYCVNAESVLKRKDEKKNEYFEEQRFNTSALCKDLKR